MKGEKELIHHDGVCYRFFLNEKSCEEDESAGEESMVTDVHLEPFNSNRSYKHSFFVSRKCYGLIIGTKGATKKKIESETNTFLKFPIGGEEGDIVIIGSSGKDIVSARHKVDTIIKSAKEKGQFTHFISIPLNQESVIQNYNEFKTSVLKNSGKNCMGVNENIFINSNKLHLTIQMLRLFNDKDLKQAAENLHACREEVIEPFLKKTGPITIEAVGVNCMEDDPTNVYVLYAKIKDENGYLQELANKISEYFIAKHLMQGKSGKYGTNVKLHMTLMKSVFPKKKDDQPQWKNWRNEPRVPFDASNIIEAHKETYFGKITLSTLHLSKIGEEDENGYYKMTAKIDF